MASMRVSLIDLMFKERGLAKVIKSVMFMFLITSLKSEDVLQCFHVFFTIFRFATIKIQSHG